MVAAAAARFGFIWLVATVPNKILPFVVGEATGDVALLLDNVMGEAKLFDGPACGLGNVPSSKTKFRIYKTEYYEDF